MPTWGAAGPRPPIVVAAWIAVGVAALAGVAVVVAFVAPIVGWALRDDPRSFDVRELDPIIAGTVVVDEPREGCPQGREPVGDCDAGAEVRSPDDRPVVEVVAANAEAAGYVATAPGSDLYRSRRDDLCLAVDEAEPSSSTVRLFLTWC